MIATLTFYSDQSNLSNWPVLTDVRADIALSTSRSVADPLNSDNVLLHFARGVDDAKCIVVTAVCVCVCLSVSRRILTLLHEPGCSLEEW